MAQTVLVTGAAGFIGSHTARRLIERGDRVIGVDNFNDYYDPAKKRANAASLSALGGDFEMLEGDIRDRAFLERAFARHPLSAVAHLAAMAGVRVSVENPWLYYDVNVTGTLNLLHLCGRHGRPNFVFASTSSAYGRTERVPFAETDPADRPLAPYPASKRAAELLGHSFYHLDGQDFTALRFFTVYGPGGRPDMMAYLVLDSMRTQKRMPLFNGGHMYRDWTYIDDIVSGIERALDRRLGYEVINLGRGEPVYLKDFVGALEKLSGKRANFESQPMVAADISYTYANIDKARRLLGYEPKVSVPEGVREFYEWYVRNVGAI